jgi:hypothetical protein
VFLHILQTPNSRLLFEHCEAQKGGGGAIFFSELSSSQLSYFESMIRNNLLIFKKNNATYGADVATSSFQAVISLVPIANNTTSSIVPPGSTISAFPGSFVSVTVSTLDQFNQTVLSAPITMSVYLSLLCNNNQQVQLCFLFAFPVFLFICTTLYTV